jgi:hypothetical protein
MQTPIPLVIVCMRAKYPMEQAKVDGQMKWVRSTRLDPKQADDILFEMFVHGWIDAGHNFRPTKYTLPELADVIEDGKPISIDSGRRLAEWARGGTPSPRKPGDRAADQAAPATSSHPAPPAGAAEVLSIEDQARKQAKRGEALFDTYWKNLDDNERERLKPIGAELRKLMNEAADA